MNFPLSVALEQIVKRPGVDEGFAFDGHFTDNAPGDEIYGCRLARLGDVVCFTGYPKVTTPVAEGSTVNILTLPPGWGGGASIALPVLDADGALVGGVGSDAGVVFVQVTKEGGLAVGTVLQVSLAWVAR